MCVNKGGGGAQTREGANDNSGKPGTNGYRLRLGIFNPGFLAGGGRGFRARAGGIGQSGKGVSLINECQRWATQPAGSGQEPGTPSGSRASKVGRPTVSSPLP